YHHWPHQSLGEIKRALQVCVEDCVPIFNRHPHAKPIARDSGVVHENVYATKLFKDSGADFLHGLMVRDINRIGVGRICLNRINFISGLLCIDPCATDTSHACAFTSKTDRDGTANASTSSRNSG